MHRSLVGLNTALAQLQLQERNINTTKMSLDHRFVFADNLVLRCRCEKDEYFPIEILDFEDIFGRLKKLLSSKVELRRNSGTGHKRELSLKNRLFDSRRTSGSDDESSEKSTKFCSSTQELLNNKKQDSVFLQYSPLMKHRRRSNKTETKPDEKQKFPKTSLKMYNCIDTIDCLNESSPDFVHVSTFADLTSAEEFLRFLRDSQEIKTIAIDIYITVDLTISVTYQRLIDFKQDFMMLDLKSSDFMLFLKPF